MNSWKENRYPGESLRQQSVTGMLVSLSSSLHETKHATITRRDSNSSTASAATDVSSINSYCGPLSGFRVGYETDIDTATARCQIPPLDHPILPLRQKSIHDEETKNTNDVGVENTDSKSTIIRKIIEDDFEFNLLREKIRKSKLVTNFAVNVVCSDYLEERCREEMKRCTRVEQGKRSNHVMRHLSMFSKHEKR